uniref:Ternary complex factor MIP1-like n=1 Tax=Zea mays TaxID=4577 RepID=A0A804U744_MAIZE
MPLPLAKARRGSSPQPSPQPARSSCRSQLEQDVKRLRKALQDETALHAVLEGALGRAAVTLADMAYLPTNAQELLSTICILETAVTKLEEEMVSLHFQLTQERNERRLVEYRLKHLPPPPSACSCHSGKLGPDDPTGEKCSSQTEEVYPRAVLHEQAVKLQRQISVKSFVDPNQLSEDIVRCMRNIFISLSDSCRDSSRNSNMENQQSIPSPTGNYSISAFWTLSEPSSISSWVQSPQVDLNYNNNVLASETVFDPYKAREKLSWADIGSYGAAAEVSWMSVGKKQLEYAAESLRKFRLFIEQLAEINPIHLSDDARLAFWINLYNALMMHAYLAYGVPRSDMKLFSLMQKAAYTIGGHSFSAAFIEYVILKMKPPSHRPQMVHHLTEKPCCTFSWQCCLFRFP